MPQWLLPILGSAMVLGIYDVCKKHAVKENSVMPVLFLSTLSGCCAFWLLSLTRGGAGEFFHCSGIVWGLIWLKALLVGASWGCVYYGLHDLPVSIASPLRATSPLWCILGGVILFGEIPTLLQALGMAVIFLGGFFFALIGQKEHFSWRSRGVVLTVAGTILGSGSALYDKFLLGSMKIPPALLQFHFMTNLAVILGIALLVYRFCIGNRPHFAWRWSIAVTGIMLVAADALYFYALSVPDARISILSLLRRSSVIVAFWVGGRAFHEKFLLPKAAALAVILLGVFILAWGK